MPLSADKWQLVVIAVNVSCRYIALPNDPTSCLMHRHWTLSFSFFLATLQCRATGPQQGGQKIREYRERERVCERDRVTESIRERTAVAPDDDHDDDDDAFLRIADTMSAHEN